MSQLFQKLVSRKLGIVLTLLINGILCVVLNDLFTTGLNLTNGGFAS